jgi:hypothetical protein
VPSRNGTLARSAPGACLPSNLEARPTVVGATASAPNRRNRHFAFAEERRSHGIELVLQRGSTLRAQPVLSICMESAVA